MPPPTLDETQQRILEFLLHHYPYETLPPQYEQRNTICGELRLALHEYDAACGGLYSQRLIVTDPPYSHDCDTIALTLAGRRAVSRPPKPGSFAWRILETLCQILPGDPPAFLPAAQLMAHLALPQDAAGLRAFHTACQALLTWGWIARQAQGENLFAELAPTPAGSKMLETKDLHG
jgi:hypothetical protein